MPSRLPVLGILADGKSEARCRCLLVEMEAKIAQFLGVSTPRKRNGLLLRNGGTAAAGKVREEVVQQSTGEDDGEAHVASPKPHLRGWLRLDVSSIGSPLCRSPPPTPIPIRAGRIVAFCQPKIATWSLPGSAISNCQLLRALSPANICDDASPE